MYKDEIDTKPEVEESQYTPEDGLIEEEQKPKEQK